MDETYKSLIWAYHFKHFGFNIRQWMIGVVWDEQSVIVDFLCVSFFWERKQ